MTPPRRPIKKKSRPKAAKTKPERKAKGKSKGAPKSTKAKSPPKPPGAHPEPTVESTKHGDQDKMYGGFVLRLYDHDMRGALPAVYDSELHKVIFDKPIKAAVATGTGSANVQDQDTKMVTKLRRHLWALGFWVFPRKYVDGVAEPEESDTFDWRTEWAVREFQIAAAMPNVATQDVKKKPSDEECKTKGKYLSTLSAKTNDQILREHPSGVVTEKTATMIKYWLDHHYRCPLVIQAFRMKNDPSAAPKAKKVKRVRAVVHTENIWRHDEVITPSKKIPDVQMYAWDFSGHYEFPEGHSNEAIYVGHYQAKPPFGGPTSTLSESWAETRVTPKSWRGKEWDDMSPAEQSTWRAIMAVASRECGGSLDVVNFWDNCHGSTGHYHWTMPKSDGSGGELCGFMAMLEEKYPSAFKLCFSDFGIWGPRWVGTAADGERKPVGDGVTFGGFVYCKDDQGKFTREPEAGKFAEANWLRSWQSAYRLEMAARTCIEYRTAMWEYARMRIVGIRTMAQVNAWLPDACRTAGGKVTLGDIFTSEQSMAFALRLHVWRPASFVSATRELVKKKNKKTGKIEEKWVGLPILHDSLKKLFAEETLKDAEGTPIDDDKDQPLKWQMPIADWTADHERILVDTMLDFAGQYTKESAKSSLQMARYWPLVLRKNSLELAEKCSDADRKKGVPTGPMLHVREGSPGLPTPPKRDGIVEAKAIEKDLNEFGPSDVHGSFTLAD